VSQGCHLREGRPDGFRFGSLKFWLYDVDTKSGSEYAVTKYILPRDDRISPGDIGCSNCACVQRLFYRFRQLQIWLQRTADLPVRGGKGETAYEREKPYGRLGMRRDGRRSDRPFMGIQKPHRRLVPCACRMWAKKSARRLPHRQLQFLCSHIFRRPRHLV
jgi:hypothetical protein